MKSIFKECQGSHAHGLVLFLAKRGLKIKEVLRILKLFLWVEIKTELLFVSEHFHFS